MAKSQNRGRTLNMRYVACMIVIEDLGRTGTAPFGETPPVHAAPGLSRLVGGTNQNAPVNMAPVGVDVVAAIALGVGIAAVAIDAITSPVAMAPAAMTVAMVRVAVADVVSGGVAEGCSTTLQTMKVALHGMIETMDAIGPREPRRSNGATVKGTTLESTGRPTEGVRERRTTERRTTGAKSGRRSAKGRTAKAHRRRRR